MSAADFLWGWIYRAEVFVDEAVVPKCCGHIFRSWVYL